MRQELTPSTRVSPAKFAHAVLRTRNLDTMADWYATVLSARTVFRTPGFAVGLTYDEEHHRIALTQIPDEIPDPMPAGTDFGDRIAAARTWSGLEHLAFTFAGLRDLLSTYLRLKDEGILPIFCVNHGGTMSMYYLDPDGNNVELQVDTMPMDQAEEMMHQKEFQENSVGFAVDPDELVEQYNAGVALKEIVKADWLSEGEG